MFDLKSQCALDEVTLGRLKVCMPCLYCLYCVTLMPAPESISHSPNTSCTLVHSVIAAAGAAESAALENEGFSPKFRVALQFLRKAHHDSVVKTEWSSRPTLSLKFTVAAAPSSMPNCTCVLQTCIAGTQCTA